MNNLTYNSEMQEVDPELHDACVCLLNGDVAVLLAAPQLGEAGRHEVRQVILHRAAAGYLNWNKICLLFITYVKIFHQFLKEAEKH